MCCLHKTKFRSVKKTQDFKRIYSQGKYAADSLFVAYALANDLQQNRLGVTVSKKIGCAVKRNRVKRWVKESYRQFAFINDGQAGYDFVIIARVPSGQLKGKGAYSQVDMSVKRLIKKVGNKVGLAL